MEYQDLDEQIEREVKRVAAAFGVEAWLTQANQEARGGPEYTDTYSTELFFDMCFGIGNSGELVKWFIYHSPDCEIELRRIIVSPHEHSAISIRRDFLLSTGPMVWHLYGQEGAELLSRGLYRLGFEDENVLSQIPKLSAHEKLELRLSMHREFWPQKWLDEEATP